MIIRIHQVIAWTVPELEEQIRHHNNLGWKEKERITIRSVGRECHAAILVNTRQVAAKPLLPTKGVNTNGQ